MVRVVALPNVDARATFEHCAGGVRDKDLQERLTQVAPHIGAAAAEMERAGRAKELESIRPTADVEGLVTAEEMSKLYGGHMVPARSRGRSVYEQILMGAPSGWCPLCGCRSASTLDHYLPKAHHPALALAPPNLVPACKDCNHTKGDVSGDTYGKGTLHPYFDDVEAEIWLVASVVETKPAAVVFCVERPDAWPTELGARIINHFDAFALGRLYAAQAAEEITNIRHELAVMEVSGGKDAVRLELGVRAAGRTAVRANSWQAATYRALSDSDWFIEEGYVRH